MDSEFEFVNRLKREITLIWSSCKIKDCVKGEGITTFHPLTCMKQKTNTVYLRFVPIINLYYYKENLLSASHAALQMYIG
jgi:hypothetical protein